MAIASRRGRVSRSARRAGHRVGPPAPDQRRAARRVSLRRHRLERGRRRDGRDAAPAAWSPPRSGSTSRRFNELDYARTVARHLGVEQHEHDRPPGHRRPAAEAGLALRRAVRRFVGGADLLRVAGGARARHRGAVGRRRRRAVGRLYPAPGRALRNCRRGDGWDRRRCGWPDDLAARLPLGVKGARSLRHLGAAARRCVRAEARLRSVRVGARAARLYSPDFAASVRGADPFASFRARLRRLRVARPARPRALRRREDLSGRRHHDQGRPDEHGGVARSARAAARSQAARVRRDGADVA